MKNKRAVVWFRNDLRTLDNEAIFAAAAAAQEVIPAFIFDKRQFARTTWFDFEKTGAHRAKFLIESVTDLRQNLRALGSDLIVHVGKPEEFLPSLCTSLGVGEIFCQKEVCSEETDVEDRLMRRLDETSKAAGLQPVSMRFNAGASLVHPDDLPFRPSSLPDVYTSFRKAVEDRSRIRPTFPRPTALPPLPPLDKLDLGTIPTLADLRLHPPPPPPPFPLPTNQDRDGPRADMVFTGGETAGLARVKEYIWEKDLLRVYKDTRDGLLGPDYSSHFSPWLALGCISPRHIYEEVKSYEATRVANQSTYWLVFELLWRDYFRFLGMKHGDQLFFRAGISCVQYKWSEDQEVFQRWVDGQTGYPLVDANMRELKATGFMSNRGRQNVASYLTKDLRINWQMGAEWFESLLLDYDPCSNWGNWQYASGVGTDPRENRRFNIVRQSKTYDPTGAYLRRWLPELRSLPSTLIHEPWLLAPAQQEQYGVRLGDTYPLPLTPPSATPTPAGQKYKGPRHPTTKTRRNH